MTQEGGGSYVDQWDCSSGAIHQMWNIADVEGTGLNPIKNQQRLGLQCLKVKNANHANGATTDSSALCALTTMAYNAHFNVIRNQYVSQALNYISMATNLII